MCAKQKVTNIGAALHECKENFAGCFFVPYNPPLSFTTEIRMKHEHNKGTIRDNALKALVRSNLFRHKTERKKKGKGSYNRQEAKKWRDGFEQPSRFYFHAASAGCFCSVSIFLPYFDKD